MHPMFVKLFIEADADDLLAEEEVRRRTCRVARPRASADPLRLSAAGSTFGA